MNERDLPKSSFKKTAAARRARAALRAPHAATGQLVELHGEKPAKRLYAAFAKYNARFFGGALGSPLVLITQAQSARTWGDYIARDVHGLESRIRIAPKAVARGDLFAADVLLHEMVHAWQEEIAKDGEKSYRGHGPLFAAECTRIGALLKLPPVGVKGRDGLPDCKAWPMCVRPAGYYPEEYKAPTRKAKPETDGGGASDGDGESGDLSNADAALVARVCKQLALLSERNRRALARLGWVISQQAQAEPEECEDNDCTGCPWCDYQARKQA
jgi:SprT-like family protein